MRRKKRFLSLLLAVCLMVGLLPASVIAAKTARRCKRERERSRRMIPYITARSKERGRRCQQTETAAHIQTVQTPYRHIPHCSCF